MTAWWGGILFLTSVATADEAHFEENNSSQGAHPTLPLCFLSHAVDPPLLLVSPIIDW